MDILNRFRQISLKAKLVMVLGGILVIIILIQAVFFPSSLPFGPVETENVQRWESQLGKFSINYPENWTAHDLPQGNHGDEEVIAAIVPKNNPLPQIYVSQKVFASQEINEVVSWGEIRNQDPYYREFGSMGLESISTSHLTGKLKEYTFLVDSLLGAEKMHCLDLYALNHELGYQFAFCVDEDNWTTMSPVFHEMIESVEFIQ